MAKLVSHATIDDPELAEKLISAPPQEGYKRILTVDFMRNEEMKTEDWTIGWNRAYVDDEIDALAVLTMLMDVTSKFFIAEEHTAGQA